MDKTRTKLTKKTLITTLYNVCSVHRGMFSTSGVFSTSGDIMSTSGDFSTSGGIMMNVGGYHEYIRGCSVHQRDTLSTSGGYHEYIRGIS